MIPKGSIIFYSGNSWVSRIIRWGQRLLKRKVKFVPSHVAIAIDDNYIWEATIGGVQKSELAKYYNGNLYFAYIPNLTEEKQNEIIKVAEKFKGRGYGYLDLLVYLVEMLGMKLGLKRGWLTKKLNKQGFLVCSEYVAYVYAIALKYHFRDKHGRWLTPSEVMPVDIWETVKKDKNFVVVKLTGEV